MFNLFKKFTSGKSMGTVSIDGVVVASGKNVSVVNGKVMVDGKDVTPESKTIHIVVNGDVNELSVDACSTVQVRGNTNKISTVSGDIECGDVSGSVSSVSGDIQCGTVGGSVSSISGDIETVRSKS
jgi:hypothetical protein